MKLEDHHLTIHVAGITRRLGFAVAGFEDHRKTGLPNRGWLLLTRLSRHGGILASGDRIKTKSGALKAGVSDLRVRLRTLLGIEGDPFYPVKKGKPYRARFRIDPASPACVATPPGTNWADVSLVEMSDGAITVNVASEVRTAVHRPMSADEKGGWEFATDAGEQSRRYRLVEWNLADATGRPTAAGTALVAVLRGRGRVRCPSTDPGMLSLGRILTDVFALDGPPFNFDPRTRTWICSFAASSRADR
jgi:hypothetical protein